MTTKRKSATGRRETKKLKLKKETVKDLDAKGKGREIKAGKIGTILCSIVCVTVGEPTCLRCRG